MLGFSLQGERMRLSVSLGLFALLLIAQSAAWEVHYIDEARYLSGAKPLSNDGTKWAYVKDMDSHSSLGDMEIFVADFVEGETYRMTQDIVRNFETAVSPDGEKVLYAEGDSYWSDATKNIYVQDIKTGQRTLVWSITP